jgi:hypothetical protein
MMRRGPLDRYPAEWVLRQAHAHRATGGIEFHTDRPLTVHVHEGHVYAACEGVGADVNLDDLSSLDEPEARAIVVALLGDVLGREAGWYYLDPLAHAATRGSWTWETATLLMETRAHAHEHRTLASWSDRSVELHPTVDAPITLGTDAWAVVAACATSASATALRDGLGWSPGRMLAALDELERHGVLDPAPAPTSATETRPAPPAPAARPAPPAPEAAAPSAAAATEALGSRRHQGPLAPPPPLSAGSLVHPAPGSNDGKGIRRRIANRRVPNG